MRLAAARSSSTSRSTTSGATRKQHERLREGDPGAPRDWNADRRPRDRRAEVKCGDQLARSRIRGSGIWSDWEFGIRRSGRPARSASGFTNALAIRPSTSRPARMYIVMLYASARGTPACDLRFPDVVHEHRPDDAGGGPRGEQAAVNRADELRAEHVGEVRGNRREPAAVHRHDDADGQHERGLAARARPAAASGRRARCRAGRTSRRSPCGRCDRRATPRRIARRC